MEPKILESEIEISALLLETVMRVAWELELSRKSMLERERVVWSFKEKPVWLFKSMVVLLEPESSPIKEKVPAEEEPRSAETEYVPVEGEEWIPEKSTDLLSEPEPEYEFMIAILSALSVNCLGFQALFNSYLRESRSDAEEEEIESCSV